MADVKWIKLNVGMFDGNSFKKIKKAKIGGESFRDKLTAVWFELMDFAGKCNAGGQLIESAEIPFSNIEDIAILIDREPEELNLCMQYYINNRMITVIDDVLMLTNWAKYQNEDGLEKIREQNRIRQKKWYDKQKALPNVTPNVRLTQPNATEEEKEEEKKKKEDKKKKKEDTHTLLERLLPEYQFSSLLEAKVREWITYKVERKEPYQEQGMKSLLTRIGKHSVQFGDQAVCDLIDECMASGWKGIIFDKLKPQAPVRQEIVPSWMPKKNSFHNFEQRSYDNDELEKLLLEGKDEP